MEHRCSAYRCSDNSFLNMSNCFPFIVTLSHTDCNTRGKQDEFIHRLPPFRLDDFDLAEAFVAFFFVGLVFVFVGSSVLNPREARAL